MMRPRRVLAGLCACLLALHLGGCEAPWTSEDPPATSSYQPPEDVSADEVLGTDPARPLTNASASRELQIPAGAGTYRDMPWSGGDPARRWGTAREYIYDPPLKIEPRTWRGARSLQGWDEPHYVTDSYGVVSLTSVTALVDVDGTLTSVSASTYDRLTKVDLGPNPPGTVEK